MANGTLKAQVIKENINPSKGSNYAAFGNSYYKKTGNVVCVHFGLSGLTNNYAANNVYTIPEGYRPSAPVYASGVSGSGGSKCNGVVNETGIVTLWPEGAYAAIDFSYIVGG